MYPDPYEFRPERFLDSRPDPAAWMPFGGGVRRCLGANFAQLELRTVLRTVLTSVRLRAVDLAAEPAVRHRFTFAPKHGCRAVVEELEPDARVRKRRFSREREHDRRPGLSQTCKFSPSEFAAPAKY